MISYIIKQIFTERFAKDIPAGLSGWSSSADDSSLIFLS